MLRLGSITRICRTIMLPCFMAATGCGGDNPPSGLQPGTYRVQFDIPVSMQTPGGLIGSHDFSFRVTNASDASDAGSVALVSSVHGSTTDYLDPSRTAHVVVPGQWRVQWRLRSTPLIGVRVNMTDDKNGGWTLPFGCNGIGSDIENYPGTNCRVTKVQ